jgi:hypothetical protein
MAPPAGGNGKPRVVRGDGSASAADADKVTDAFLELFAGVAAPGDAEPLWAVHRNRPLEVAMRESTATVKADAARHLFDVTGRGIRWAVIDTGIDARHVAFRRRGPTKSCGLLGVRGYNRNTHSWPWRSEHTGTSMAAPLSSHNFT